MDMDNLHNTPYVNISNTSQQKCAHSILAKGPSRIFTEIYI